MPHDLAVLLPAARTEEKPAKSVFGRMFHAGLQHHKKAGGDAGLSNSGPARKEMMSLGGRASAEPRRNRAPTVMAWRLTAGFTTDAAKVPIHHHR